MSEYKRLNYLDIAKFIGIILMFIGHRSEGFLHNFIYLFHMPLFFIISGVVMKKRKYSNILDILISEKRLIASYLFYSTVFILFNYVENMYYGSTSGMIFKTLTLYGVDSMWFFSTLLLSKICVKYLDYKENTKKSLIIFILYTISYVVSLRMRMFAYDDIKMRIIKYTSYAILRFGVCSTFVFVGYKFKDYINKYVCDNKKVDFLFLMVGVVVLCFFASTPRVDYHTLRNGYYVISVGLAIIGSILILKVSYIIDKNMIIVGRFLGKLGKESMHLMTVEHFHLLDYIILLCTVIFKRELAVIPVILFVALLIVLSIYVYPYVDILITKISNIIFRILSRNPR